MNKDITFKHSYSDIYIKGALNMMEYLRKNCPEDVLNTFKDMYCAYIKTEDIKEFKEDLYLIGFTAV